MNPAYRLHLIRYNASVQTLRLTLLLAGILLLLGQVGCVRRTITITSTPPGALVYLNDEEVGRTPVEVDFLYYGEYDVRLVHDGHDPLVTSAHANAPWWDTIGLDLIAEAVPGEPHARIEWHFELQPESPDPAGMLDRAQALRDRLGPAPESPESSESPSTPENSDTGER